MHSNGILRSASASLRRVMAICVKELIQLRRDRLTFAMVVAIPLIQLLLFGYTINTDVRNVPVAVVDQRDNFFSRQLIEDLQASQVIKVHTHLETPQQATDWVRAGKVSAALIVPRDVEKRFYNDNQEPIAQLVVDGSDTILASALKGLSDFPFDPSQPPSPRQLAKNITVDLLYNPEQRAALFTVPGLLGVILTMTLTMFTAIAIVRERERGNLELLIATPVKTPELMLGKLVPYIGLGLLQVVIILLLGRFFFDLPVVGSPALLMLCCLLFIFANLGLGLLISTRAPNQLGAMQMAVFILLPSILLSGFMFPYAAMPRFAQHLAEILPMTHFIRLTRGIILRGADFSDLAGDMLFLALFFIGTMIVALKSFRKKLD